MGSIKTLMKRYEINYKHININVITLAPSRS